MDLGKTEGPYGIAARDLDWEHKIKSKKNISILKFPIFPNSKIIDYFDTKDLKKTNKKIFTTNIFDQKSK